MNSVVSWAHTFSSLPLEWRYIYFIKFMLLWKFSIKEIQQLRIIFIKKINNKIPARGGDNFCKIIFYEVIFFY